MKKGVEDLEVYQIAFNLAMEIFELSKKFPGSEKYSLIDQIIAFPNLMRYTKILTPDS